MNDRTRTAQVMLSNQGGKALRVRWPGHDVVLHPGQHVTAGVDHPQVVTIETERVPRDMDTRSRQWRER